MRILRVRLTVASVVGILALLSSCAVQPLATATNDGVYVALGDSYAAGPGITATASGPPGWARRSTRSRSTPRW
jgi:hypothetical protein